MMFIFGKSSSNVVKLIFGAINLFCAIKTVYTASLAPAIQHSCPVIDFVEETGVFSPKTVSMVAASTRSPVGVDVAWALI